MHYRIENVDPDVAPAPVASYRHTAILTGILLVIALAGAWRVVRATAGAEEPPGNLIPLYLSVLASEWALVWYVWRVGLRRHGTRLRDLVGGRWTGWPQVVRDLGLAAGLWGIWMGLERGWELWMGPERADLVRAYLPHGVVEVGLFIALSLSAGFCEEVAFRGYFQHQLTALTRHRAAGVVLQALLFGVVHSYEGLVPVVRITIFGLLFGAVAAWRKSLRPGIAAHAWTDLWAGWLSGVV